ncbi:hypothetical protein VUR80DRAFT_8314 [Thermomyces stellatus]
MYVLRHRRTKPWARPRGSQPEDSSSHCSGGRHSGSPGQTAAGSRVRNSVRSEASVARQSAAGSTPHTSSANPPGSVEG